MFIRCARDAAEKCFSAISTLSQDVGIPTGLAALGVKEEDFALMTGNAKLDACQFTNPRTATFEQVIQFYKNEPISRGLTCSIRIQGSTITHICNSFCRGEESP